MNIIRQMSGEAWGALTENPKALLNAILLPGLILVVTEFTSREFSFSYVLIQGLSAIAYVILAVQTHRHILLQGAQPVVPTRIVDIGHYLLWTLIIMLMFGILAAPSYLGIESAAIPIFLSIIPLLYVSSRISLVLPNRAVGGRATLGEAWSWSNNNGWKLTGSLFLPPFIISLAISITSFFLSTSLHGLLIGISAFSTTVFTIALLSVTYRNLNNIRSNEP